MNSGTSTPFAAPIVEEKLEDSLELDIRVETVEISDARGESPSITMHTFTTCALC